MYVPYEQEKTQKKRPASSPLLVNPKEIDNKTSYIKLIKCDILNTSAE